MLLIEKLCHHISGLSDHGFLLKSSSCNLSMNSDVEPRTDFRYSIKVLISMRGNEDIWSGLCVKPVCLVGKLNIVCQFSLSHFSISRLLKNCIHMSSTRAICQIIQPIELDSGPGCQYQSSSGSSRIISESSLSSFDNNSSKKSFVSI